MLTHCIRIEYRAVKNPVCIRESCIGNSVYVKELLLFLNKATLHVFSEFISNLLFCHLVLYPVIELRKTGSPVAFLCCISNNSMFPSRASDPVRGGTLVYLASRSQEQLMMSQKECDGCAGFCQRDWGQS